MRERRWDTDERGIGVASGERMAPALREHLAAMSAEGWVAEDPEAHLLPHLRRACERTDAAFELATSEVSDAELVVTLRPRSNEMAEGEVRGAAFALIGEVAESSTQVRQRTVSDGIEFEVSTGMLEADTPFRGHGHLLRLRILHPEA